MSVFFFVFIHREVSLAALMDGSLPALQHTDKSHEIPGENSCLSDYWTSSYIETICNDKSSELMV